MEILQSHAVKNLCYIAAQKMMPKGIVVHSTGANNPNLKRYVDCPEQLGVNRYGNHWNTSKPGGRKVCVHAFIGYDKDKTVRVAEILPLDICCWGVGKGSKGSFNYDPAYIQFEICEDGLHNEIYYRKVFELAAEYCAYLCRKYNLSVENIVSHKEAHEKGYGSNHGDPEHWMKIYNENMDDFRQKVSVLLAGTMPKTETGECTEVSAKPFCDGDLVSIAGDATYFDGTPIPDWVKAQRWYIAGEPAESRAVINENESCTHAIRSPIHTKYLTAVLHGEMQNMEKGYLVKVTADSLNIRENAGINTKITGCITDKGVYTIIEEKTGEGAALWGKLKSGAGWISLDYTRKL